MISPDQIPSINYKMQNMKGFDGKTITLIFGGSGIDQGSKCQRSRFHPKINTAAWGFDSRSILWLQGYSYSQTPFNASPVQCSFPLLHYCNCNKSSSITPYNAPSSPIIFSISMASCPVTSAAKLVSLHSSPLLNRNTHRRRIAPQSLRRRTHWLVWHEVCT